MSDQQLQNLIKMINQISINNLHHGDEDQAAEVVTTHIRKFWARSMKQQIIAYAESDGLELSSVSRLAVKRLAEPQTA
ncbi:formate dehydrogenase subunit delta [Marinobacter subterrani]|uniref:NADH-dependent formate dehydrogenase delta subunit FdsD n=1 Tax=Marinobacter subterrani TaxID=1658765 RepID=A0A0J7J444_9GAMM|nr:formate dehydrogenase subunit delta [Marinobacter subterrani]KMQ72977.1 NADH-dependent formate dehydrogenase delta subunit FdsD [Marinobacter subterrani]